MNSEIAAPVDIRNMPQISLAPGVVAGSELPSQPSEWRNPFNNPIADVYFQPLPFESEGLYRCLGVTVFKKLVPNHGDLMMKTIRRFKPGYSFIRHPNDTSREESVETFETFTRAAEAAHTGFSAIFGAVMLGEIESHDWKDLVYVGALQTVVNTYPILLQRYNRLRANKILRTIRQSKEN